MTLPEHLAKIKWCPWSRLANGANRTHNSSAEILAGTRCMASDCMAWLSDDDAKTGRCGLVGHK